MDKRRKNAICYELLYGRFLFVCFPICNTPLWLTWFSEMSFLIKMQHGLQFCKLKWIKISLAREFHDTLRPLLEIIGDTLGYHRPGLRKHHSLCCLTCVFMRTKLTAAVHYGSMIECAWSADKLISTWGNMKNAFHFLKEVEQKMSKCESGCACV